jgi:DNA-binding MarR family transcriptional regulator
MRLANTSLTGEEAPSERVDARPDYENSSDLGEDTRQRDFHSYVGRVAQARYVMRRVLRILDDSAKSHGLDGMEHQALLQVAGTPSGSIAIHQLAERLDIASAFASRLVKQLAWKQLIARSGDDSDRRVTLASVNPAGIELLRRIDEDVHRHMAYFQAGIGLHDRGAAMAIFAFYVGEQADSQVAVAIRAILKE